MILGIIFGAIIVTFLDFVFIDDFAKLLGPTMIIVFVCGVAIFLWRRTDKEPIKVNITGEHNQNKKLNEIKSSLKGITTEPNFKLTSTLDLGITNKEFPKFGDEIYFLPEGVAYGTRIFFNRYDWKLIDYENVSLKTEVVEEPNLPKGAHSISSRWEYINKDGSKDKRRKDKRILYTFNITILEINKYKIKINNEYKFPKVGE